MERKAGAALSVLLLAGCGTLNFEAAPPSSPLQQAAESSTKKKVHDYALSVSATPAVRFRCTLFAKALIDGGPLEPHMVDWDPQASTPLLRTLRLRTEAERLECGSEVLTVGGKDSDTLMQYQRDPAVPDANLMSANGPWNFQLKEVSGRDAKGPTLAVSLQHAVRSLTGSDLLRQASTPVARTRSLEPLSPLADDALKAVATVAVERAKMTGQVLLQHVLDEFFCSTALGGQNGPFRGIVPSGKVSFPNTCAVVKTVRVEDIAGSSRLLERALARDLIHIGVLVLNSSTTDKEKPSFQEPLEGVERMIVDLLDGRSITSERDVQLAALDIIRWASAGPKTTKLLDDGLAALATCLEEGPCTADELLKQLGDVSYQKDWPELPQVLSHLMDILRPPPGISARATAKAAFNVELDVLRHALQEGWGGKAEKLLAACKPAIDTCLGQRSCAAAARQPDTATCGAVLLRADDIQKSQPEGNDAGQLAFDTLEPVLESEFEAGGLHSVVSWEKALENVRGLVNAVLDDDIGRAVQSASAFMSDVIDAQCDQQPGKRCSLPVKSSNVRKAFAIAGAFVAYSASYRPSSGDPAHADEELKARAEERKKAMESLIDAATDRHDRAHESVISLGVAVGASIVPGGATSKGNARGQLTLPLGPSFEVLPASPGLGVHAGLSLLDIAQYASTDGDQTAKAELGTAVFLGGRAGVLIGYPNASLLVGADGGYAPAIKFGDGTRGLWRLGVFVGTYVPFADFN